MVYEINNDKPRNAKEYLEAHGWERDENNKWKPKHWETKNENKLTMNQVANLYKNNNTTNEEIL